MADKLLPAKNKQADHCESGETELLLTQFAKELHSQSRVDEEEQHEEEPEISHLETKRGYV